MTSESSKPVLLVAEDNNGNFILEHLLLSGKYEIFHAWNGADALEMYVDLNPCVVLMDIRMPKMDGIKCAERIKEINPKALIVAVTAFAWNDEEEHYLNMGFDGFITKPFDINTFEQTITEIVSKN